MQDKAPRRPSQPNGYSAQANVSVQPPKKKKNAAAAVIAVLGVVCAATIVTLSVLLATAVQDNGPQTSGSGTTTSQDASKTSSGSHTDLNLDIQPEAEEGLSTAAIVQKNLDSTVQLTMYDNSTSASGAASGIVLSEDGYIITNAHVVENSSLLKVVLNNEEVYEAKLIGSDADTDLALLKIEATGLTPIEIGDYDALAVGDFVMAVGNPGGMEFSSSVTFGIVSAKDRPMDIDGGYTMNTIQTDAAINPGNSGGALVNMDGKLVGINSAKYVATGYEGLGFSITVEEALPIVESLKEYGEVKGRSRLGVTGMIIDELVANRYGLTPGFYVNEVTNENAGTLKAGDVITAVDGAEVSSESDIKNALQKKQAGDSVTIKYWRSGAQQETQLVLISADADETP